MYLYVDSTNKKLELELYQESFTYDKVNNTRHSGHHHYILCYNLTYVQYSSVSSLNKNLQSTLLKGTTPDITNTIR